MHPYLIIRRAKPKFRYLVWSSNNVLNLNCEQGIRDYLRQMLNFTLKLGSPQDKKWGSLSKDGKVWNGMIRQLLDDEIDMCAAGLSITFDRAMATDFR